MDTEEAGRAGTADVVVAGGGSAGAMLEDLTDPPHPAGPLGQIIDPFA